jgi:hypothetical protein
MTTEPLLLLAAARQSELQAPPGGRPVRCDVLPPVGPAPRARRGPDPADHRAHACCA